MDNKIEKKMKLVVKKMKTRVNKEDGKNTDEKIKELLFKTRQNKNSWLLTTNCSTNHANLLMIVASHLILSHH